MGCVIRWVMCLVLVGGGLGSAGAAGLPGIPELLEGIRQCQQDNRTGVDANPFQFVIQRWTDATRQWAATVQTKGGNGAANGNFRGKDMVFKGGAAGRFAPNDNTYPDSLGKWAGGAFSGSAAGPVHVSP